VKRFADFLGRSPAGASAEDLHRFQLQLVASGVGARTFYATLTALRGLENRIRIFAALPLASLDLLKLQQNLDEIGRTRLGGA